MSVCSFSLASSEPSAAAAAAADDDDDDANVDVLYVTQDALSFDEGTFVHLQFLLL